MGQPAYVALCHDAKQVVQAVQRAVDDGRRITVRGGGHCYEDFVSQNDGGVIIDLSPMNSVWRDPDSGWYGVASGATLWDVYRRFHADYGVTLARRLLLLRRSRRTCRRVEAMASCRASTA